MPSEAALSDGQVEELAYQALLAVGGGAGYWEVQRAVEDAIREGAAEAVEIAREMCPLCGRPWKKREKKENDDT